MLNSHSRKKMVTLSTFFSMMPLSCLFVVTPKNSNFPNFIWGEGGGGGGQHQFLIVRYSVQIILFFLNIWVEVDKPLKISGKGKFLEIICVFVVAGVAAK